MSLRGRIRVEELLVAISGDRLEEEDEPMPFIPLQDACRICVLHVATFLAVFRKEMVMEPISQARMTGPEVTVPSLPSVANEYHYVAVKWILRYLKGTPNLGLWYPRSNDSELIGFSDADFVGSKDDRKSTSRTFQFLGRRLISWSRKKQNCVTISTAESEYISAGSCCAQLLWLKNQLEDYNMQVKDISLFCDSSSAIAIANNPVSHSRTKHIERVCGA
ncbi:hypothetical protein KSP39_PZI020180 [Platanthera zijinensis]|uniref:Uncharacterized protein n=1 Tax=Platanthera zijinensis TaxID=2320716 RepID=A0AAP0AZG7_9ASPA